MKNYYHPTSADTLRNSMARSMDRNGTAFKVTELMDKNGDKNLAGALEEEVLPALHDVPSTKLTSLGWSHTSNAMP